jgi:hypothetical protein
MPSCLIVERLPWETGGTCSQVQIPLKLSNQFFGKNGRPITVRVFMPRRAKAPCYSKEILISKIYKNGTRRINHFPELGSIGPSLLFFEKTPTPNVFDFWWESGDTHVIAAQYNDWYLAPGSQHGRGRIAIIVSRSLRNAR